MSDYPNLRMIADHGTSLTLRALRKEAAAALEELAWLKRVYSVFIEASPPGDQKAFAEACFAAWEEKCELDQALDHLLDAGWEVRLLRTVAGETRAGGRRPIHGPHRIKAIIAGSTLAEAIIGLAAKAAKSTETVESKGA